MKRYVAMFTIFNGECKYTMPIGRQAENKREAKKIFKEYECDNMNEIWRLDYFEEVKDFDNLWDFVEN